MLKKMTMIFFLLGLVSNANADGGLNAYYYWPYFISGYIPEERVYRTETVSNLNKDWGNSAICQNVGDTFILWNGTLSVDQAGRYAFRFWVDDTAALWIDDKPVIRENWGVDNSGKARTGTCELAAGEHRIRIYSFHFVNANYFGLYWTPPGGVEEVVPSARLTPSDYTLPEPWSGERTFFQNSKGHIGFQTPNSLLLYSGKGIFNAERDGRHQLWTTQSGNFDFSFHFKYPAENPEIFPNLKSMVSIMVRTTLDSGGKAFALSFCGDSGGYYFEQGIRNIPANAVPTKERGEVLSGGCEGELRVVRYGQKLYTYVKDGTSSSWTLFGEPLNMGGYFDQTLYIGPSASSLEMNGSPFELTDVKFTPSGETEPLLPPMDRRMVLEGKTPLLTWGAAPGAEGYVVSRLETGTDGLPSWSEQARFSSEIHMFKDVDHPFDSSVRSLYRIGSVRGSEVVFSEPVYLSYEPGNGTGLYALYRAPYDLHNPGEETLGWNVDPTVSGRWGTASVYGDVSDNITVKWSGELIVPLEGDYTFTLQVDDCGALWIDGRPVINARWNQLTSELLSGSIHLEAGRHPIEIDYREISGKASCVLFWESPFIRKEIIPSSQLDPAEKSLPDGWAGERTFGQYRKGNIFENADNGDLLFWAGGGNFYGNGDARHQLWQSWTGDFDLVAHCSLGEGNEPFLSNDEANFGLMARNSLTKNSPLLLSELLWIDKEKKNLASTRIALRQGDIPVESSRLPASSSGWIRLVRKGNTWYFFMKSDLPDAGWEEIRSAFTDQDGVFGRTLLVGPYAGSGTMTLHPFWVSGLSLSSPGTNFLSAPQSVSLVIENDLPVFRWSKGEGTPESYRIALKDGNGGLTTLGEVDSGTFIYRHPVEAGKADARFVVGAVRGEEVVWSHAFKRSPYLDGNGNGLHAVYRKDYLPEKRFIGETVVTQKVDSAINFNWNMDGIVTYMGIDWTDAISVTWNGRLIVPISGNYEFYFSVDDSVSLWIGERNILDSGICKGPLVTGEISASCFLEKGIYPIRIYYSEEKYYARCIFKWRCLPHFDWEVVPTSQLLQEPFTLPPGWEDERSFNQTLRGYVSSYDTETKSFSFYGGNGDFAGDRDGYHYVWRKYRGNFDLRFAYSPIPGQETRIGSKLMLMVRSLKEPLSDPQSTLGLETGTAALAAALVQQNGEKTFDFMKRCRRGGRVEGLDSPLPADGEGELRIVRLNRSFRCYGRRKGDGNWIQIGPSFGDSEGMFSDEVLIGPALSAPEGLQGYRISHLSVGEYVPGSLLLLY